MPFFDSAFVENDHSRIKRTRATLVVHDGKLVAERYAPGITPSTPLIGWSMTKSVTNAMIGILVKDGILGLEKNNLFPNGKKMKGKISP